MKKLCVILCVLCVFLCGCGKLKLKTTKKEEAAKVVEQALPPGESVLIDDYTSDWDTNSVAAEKRYLHKRVPVIGTVARVDKGTLSGFKVTLKGNKPTRFVHCWFKEAKDVETLKEWDTLIIEGKATNKRELTDCMITKRAKD